MIEISNLTKKFGKFTAVDNISLSIKDNEILALLGLNGAGKSTTINILCSLLEKTEGKIVVNGYDLDKDRLKIKELINVSPQETAVGQSLTVYENLDFIANLYEIKDREEKVKDMLEKLSLTSKAKCRAKTLSGGQKRRLSIAMALITDPKILILDEPTLGLDIKVRRELWKIIENYKKDRTIILTTHYLEEAVALADRIAIMNKGQIVATGTEQEIVNMTNTDNFEDAFLALAGGSDDE